MEGGEGVRVSWHVKDWIEGGHMELIKTKRKRKRIDLVGLRLVWPTAVMAPISAAPGSAVICKEEGSRA